MAASTPPGQSAGLQHVARRLRPAPWFGPAVVAIAAGVTAALSAIAMPRGPATTAHALVVMATGAVIGIVAGLAWPRRRAMVLAAVAYVVCYELARPAWAGPSVGAIRFDSMVAVVMLVAGRGFHGLLVFLPMIVSGSLVRLAGSLRRPASIGRAPHGRMRRLARQTPPCLGVLATLALALVVVAPASAPPVLGADGAPIPGSLAELATVTLGGHDQAVMIRAESPDKPVLLYLSGGPGQSDLAYSRALASGWVRDFVFVDWDQRGNGKSYAALDPLSTMTLDQAVSDTIELTDYLRQRFGERKIYLMGESWGTILGVLAVQRRPDLYYAYMGSGQMVDVLETDRRIYADLVAYADRVGDGALASNLRDLGGPPYRDFPFANVLVAGWYDYLYKPYTPSAGYRSRGASSGIGLYGMLGSEYTLVEKTNVLRGLADTFAVMYPQLYAVDFRRDVPSLDVPVYLLDGAAELEGRRDLAIEWFDQLVAPVKQRVTYQDAAHSVAFEQADEVQELLVQTVVPATYGD